MFNACCVPRVKPWRENEKLLYVLGNMATDRASQRLAQVATGLNAAPAAAPGSPQRRRSELSLGRRTGTAAAAALSSGTSGVPRRGVPPRRPRARELGIWPGGLPTGPHNAITDVPGVLVGQVTLTDEPAGVNTGGTAVLPHGGSLYSDKVPAAVVVGNGYGKLAGSTQVDELGEIETPILLTNTLSVGNGMQAVIDFTLDQPGSEEVRSVNCVVGETNDGNLNDIRSHYNLTPTILREAIDTAVSGPVAEGGVGAGAGTMCYSMKGGIGTSSRRVIVESTVRPSHGVAGSADSADSAEYTVGVLVQTNFGSLKDLIIMGVPVGAALTEQGFVPNEALPPETVVDESPDGSLMVVLATDAPLGDRQLKRLGLRALMGVARTNAGTISNGSGDYVVAFSSTESVRKTPERRSSARTDAATPEVANYNTNANFVLECSIENAETLWNYP